MEVFIEIQEMGKRGGGGEGMDQASWLNWAGVAVLKDIYVNILTGSRNNHCVEEN